MVGVKLYKNFFDVILNPTYGLGYTLPYYIGSIRAELLAPNHVIILGIEPLYLASEIVDGGQGRVRLSIQVATWNNVNGTVRYVRIYDSVTPSLEIGSDKYLMELDLQRNIFLDDDTFSVFFNLGLINFDGNLI